MVRSWQTLCFSSMHPLVFVPRSQSNLSLVSHVEQLHLLVFCSYDLRLVCYSTNVVLLYQITFLKNPKRLRYVFNFGVSVLYITQGPGVMHLWMQSCCVKSLQTWVQICLRSHFHTVASLHAQRLSEHWLSFYVLPRFYTKIFSELPIEIHSSMSEEIL